MVDDEEYTREELMDAAIEKMYSIYAYTYSWEIYGRDAFSRDVENFSDAALRDMVERPEEDFAELANYGFELNMEEPPDWLLELGWYDDDGDWHNPFWYH